MPSAMNHPRISLYTAIIALAIPFWVYFGEPRRIGLLVLSHLPGGGVCRGLCQPPAGKDRQSRRGLFLCLRHLLLPLLRGAGGGLGTADELYLPAHPAPLRGGCGRDDLRHVFGEAPDGAASLPEENVGGVHRRTHHRCCHCHLSTASSSTSSQRWQVNYYFLAVYGVLGGVITERGRPGLFLCQAQTGRSRTSATSSPVTAACWTASTA